MQKTGYKKEERVELAKQRALNIRKERLLNNPGDFVRISGTCARTPTTEHLRELADFDFVPICPVDIKDFEFIPFLVGGKKYVSPSQVASIESERILLLKSYYQENFCPLPYDYESPESYALLPESNQLSLLFDYTSQHTFASYYIFGTKFEFRCAAKKFNANPFLIADAYEVPFLYVMYQMAEYGINRCHFWTAINKKSTRVIGNGFLLLNNLDQNDFLIKILEGLAPEYYNQLIYRTMKIYDAHFICMGVSREKRGKNRIHVFGMNREFSDHSTVADLRFVGTRLNSRLLK